MENSVTIRDILASFFRQYKTFRLIFFVAILFGVVSLVISTPLYEASGSLLIKFGADADAKVTETKSGEPLTPSDRREIIQSNIDIIRSHDLLKMVIEKVGIERVYPKLTEKVGKKDSPIEVAIKNLDRNHLSVKSSSQSNIIDVNVMNPNPKVAAELVDAIQNIFITRQLEIFNKPQTIFLQEQVKLAEERLNKSQQKLRDFKSSVGISSIEEEINELLKQKSNAAAVAFQAVDDAQAKLSELKDKEAEMLTTYKASSPAIKALRKSIAEAQRQLDDRKKNLDSSSEESTLSGQNDTINKRISQLEAQRGTYNDLARQVQVDETSYKNYVERSEEARINATLGERKITSVVVVDSPVEPIKPARPRKLLTLIAAIMAGMVLGGIAVFAREIFDERFRTPRQLARSLKLPVLADFPKKDAMVQLFNGIDHLFSTEKQPIIQFVSSYENENVDRLARELSAFAAHKGKKVLLVNTKDMQKNIEKAHSDFITANPESWTIITNSGLLSDDLGQSLAKIAHGTIIIVEAENTRAPVVKEVKRLTTSLGGKVIGAVLTNRKFYIPNWLYKILYKSDK